MCVYVCVVCACMHICGNRRTAIQNWFYSSTVWLPGMELRSPSSVSAFRPLSCLPGSGICSFKTSIKATFLGNLRVFSSAWQVGKLLSVETDWRCLRSEVSIPNSRPGHSSEKCGSKTKTWAREIWKFQTHESRLVDPLSTGRKTGAQEFSVSKMKRCDGFDLLSLRLAVQLQLHTFLALPSAEIRKTLKSLM